MAGNERKYLQRHQRQASGSNKIKNGVIVNFLSANLPVEVATITRFLIFQKGGGTSREESWP